MPSLTKLAQSGLLYPLNCAEGLITSGTFDLFFNVGNRAVRLWAALAGVVAAGATALLLLRTMAMPHGPVIWLEAYLGGAAVAIVCRLVFARLFARREDAV